MECSAGLRIVEDVLDLVRERRWLELKNVLSIRMNVQFSSGLSICRMNAETVLRS